MELSAEDEKTVDEAIKAWRQGDVTLDDELEFCHLADLSCPHSPASIHAADEVTQNGNRVAPGPTPLLDPVVGLVVLSQTCDIVRPCQKRHFIEVSPLIEVDTKTLEEVRLLKRPGFAYVPAIAHKRLVADLDRTMTIEKALAIRWQCIRGCRDDAERRDFAHALSRKRSRFAFPDDFQEATADFQERMADKHFKQSDEGAHIRALSEIRVRAAPSWDEKKVYLTFWFIKKNDPSDAKTVNWSYWVGEWLKLIKKQDRFYFDPPTVARLEDITARDYCESDRLDLDNSSIPRRT